jgi:hypothetical protein
MLFSIAGCCFFRKLFADGQRMPLPKVVFKKKANKPLVTTATRRSYRLNNMDVYKHVQLEDTPRKKRKVLTAPATHSMEAPQSPQQTYLHLFPWKLFKLGPSSAVCLLVRSH